MIVTFAADNKKLDVMVKPEQKIEEVYQRLRENGYFTSVCHGRQIRVYSLSKKAYLNSMLSFQEGKIFQGDILLIECELY